MNVYVNRWWCSTLPFKFGGIWWREVIDNDLIYFVLHNKDGIFFRIWMEGDERVRNDNYDIDKMNKYITTNTCKDIEIQTINDLFDILNSHTTISPSGRFAKSLRYACQCSDSSIIYKDYVKQEFSCLEEYILWTV